jgi:DNA-directed RNA polymerase I, II, and III subunit RPABC2
MSDLEEVDVEQQLKKAEESGEDTASIILSEPEDDDDELLSGTDDGDPKEDDMGQDSDVEDDDNTYNVGDFVTTAYQPEFEVQPVYKIKEITDEGKYVIERQVEEGTSTPSPETVDKDFLSPVAPKSPSPGPVADTSPPFVIEKTPEEEADNLEEISSEEEDSDDEEYNENMKKLEQDINRDYLYAYHPETKQINYKELLTLSNITRNKKGIIIDPLHQTIPILTRYEKAKILGLRAKQINHGSKPFVEITRDIIDGHTIAHMELTQNKIPFIIRRPMPNGGSEYWKISDLKNLD